MERGERGSDGVTAVSEVERTKQILLSNNLPDNVFIVAYRIKPRPLHKLLCKYVYH